MNEFVCPICLKTLKNGSAFSKHINQHKNPINIQCPFCNQVCKTSSSFNRHLNSHHPSKQEEAFLILHNFEAPLCPVCANKRKFLSFSKEYALTCGSRVCINKQNSIRNTGTVGSEESKINRRNTCIKNLGVDNPSKSKEVKDGMKKRSLIKHGYEYPTQSPKIQEKISKGLLKANEIDCPSHTESANKKRAETCEGRYGTEFAIISPSVIEKREASMIERHGIKNAFASGLIRVKTEKTFFDRYGFTSYAKSDQYKALYEDKDWVQNTTFKRHCTQKANGTFKTSKPEAALYELLKQQYPSVEFQKRDYPNFPFNVDFYIPEHDLLIEYQGSWTHGPEPFDTMNKAHQDILEKWNIKSETSDYYLNAIRIWTVRDPNKAKIAKDLGVKYLRLYDRDINNCLNFIQDYVA